MSTLPRNFPAARPDERRSRSQIPPTRATMPRALVALTLLSLVGTVAPASAADARRIIQIEVTDEDALRQLLDQGAHPLACRPAPGPSDWLVSETQWREMQTAGLQTRLLIADVPALLAAQREQREAAGRRSADWYATYHPLSDIEEKLAELNLAHPQNSSLLNLGTSFEGRPLWGLRIGAGSGPARPAVLFNGGQHAREWVSVLIPVFIAESLLTQYGSDPTVTSLLDSVDIYVVPVVNPDGYVYSHTNDRFWRKNRRTNGGTCRGVDLNRNWPEDWNGSHSTSNAPCSDVYVGTSAFSEPETTALKTLVESHPELVAHIDFHSYSQLILQAWGYTNDLPTDFDQVDALGAEMNRAIEEIHGQIYPHASGDGGLYLASGTAPDWTHAQSIFGYTIELRPRNGSGGGFELPPEQIRPTAEENYAAALRMIAWAAPASCGNGILEKGEECDGPAGTSCSGACSPASCTCVPACSTTDCACDATPRSDCRAAGTNKARLRIVDKTNDRSDSLSFLWARGSEGAQSAEFGTPFTAPGTEVTLCLYETENGSPSLIDEAHVTGTEGWRPLSGGFSFRDSDATQGGVRRILLKAPRIDRAKLKIQRKGVHTVPPDLPLQLPVRAQLIVQADQNTTCWEAEFANPQKNRTDVFQAKGPG